MVIRQYVCQMRQMTGGQGTKIVIRGNTWILADEPSAAELLIFLEERNVINAVPSLESCSQANGGEASPNTGELTVTDRIFRYLLRVSHCFFRGL